MAHRGVEGAFGDLAERRARVDSKYDKELEKIHIAFIEANTGEKMTGTFQEWLKSGVVLCNLINALQPGSVKKIHPGSMAFKQMENISNFLTALPAYGVRPEDVFRTSDLYEGVDMTAVQLCLENVRRVADMKKKGVKVEAQAPQRNPVSLPKGSAKLGEVKAPASSGSGPKYAEAKTDDAAYGDLAERMARLKSKYNPEVEKEVRAWIEKKTGEKVEGDFQAALRDGVILCKLANAIKPGAVAKINQSSMAFKQMENISNFIEFARGAGISSSDLFQTVALYEGENMTQVLLTLDNLKRKHP
ncbi:hypothetical protein PTSG_05487 [Salpingoeca rosetta]|uniref:Calponin-homology (CH) domain-containing protein n=1 Tax=Salpingoeca rosetta (strain ATCC 50818 / BSB-021) TaxID=946362 RepID=F2UBC8_SALR5|nr:uncharacterized protein PTSG_05487 [Salpingoeca rosetta]EGD73794.1 hypothetical protein PTSG_05487 [Salpingoeca rosetta]|eukprot:XP_004993357.1 hypothetical protein PTSG_05487 [Salpingoeca rosetta]